MHERDAALCGLVVSYCAKQGDGASLERPAGATKPAGDDTETGDTCLNLFVMQTNGKVSKYSQRTQKDKVFYSSFSLQTQQ